MPHPRAAMNPVSRAFRPARRLHRRRHRMSSHTRFRVLLVDEAALDGSYARSRAREQHRTGDGRTSTCRRRAHPHSRSDSSRSRTRRISLRTAPPTPRRASCAGGMTTSYRSHTPPAFGRAHEPTAACAGASMRTPGRLGHRAMPVCRGSAAADGTGDPPLACELLSRDSRTVSEWTCRHSISEQE